MLPITLYYFLTIVASFAIIFFVIYYSFKIHLKEKELDAKLKKVDTEYHKVVDDAQTKERKILEDATSEADKIITDAHYVSTSSKDTLDKALEHMVTDFEKESNDSGRSIMNSYQETLKQITGSSLKNFDGIAKELEADLQKQIKTFNETQMANLQKTFDEYKASQLKQSQELVGKVVKQVSEEVLNKTISIEDHQKLVIESFEKAKKEGLFE